MCAPFSSDRMYNAHRRNHSHGRILAVQYEHRWLNKLERSALSINVLTLLFGTGLYTNEQASESRNAVLAEVLSVGIVFLNVAFVGNVGRSWWRHGQYCAQCRKEATREEPKGENEVSETDGQAQRRVGRHSRMGQVSRSGTIRGSLRYNVGVAIQLEKAQQNVSSYQETLKTRQERTHKIQSASLSRLQSRLKIRKANSRAKKLRQRGAVGAGMLMGDSVGNGGGGGSSSVANRVVVHPAAQAVSSTTTGVSINNIVGENNSDIGSSSGGGGGGSSSCNDKSTPATEVDSGRVIINNTAPLAVPPPPAGDKPKQTRQRKPKKKKKKKKKLKKKL